MKTALPMKVLTAALSAALLVGCGSLAEVREYAGASARLSDYAALTDRFRDTYERERPFLGSGAYCSERNAKLQDAQRQAAYPDLIRMQDRLADYMSALAALAGDGAFSLDASAKQLGGAIAEHADLGIGAAQVGAYVELGGVITRLATSGMQQQAIRKAVTSADPAVQTLVEGMEIMVDVYKVNNNKERGCVVEFLEQESSYAMRHDSTALTGAIGRQLALDKAKEYKRVDEVIVQVRSGLKAIREGHTELLVNLNRLSMPEVAATLQNLTREINNARAAMANI